MSVTSPEDPQPHRGQRREPRLSVRHPPKKTSKALDSPGHPRLLKARVGVLLRLSSVPTLSPRIHSAPAEGSTPDDAHSPVSPALCAPQWPLPSPCSLASAPNFSFPENPCLCHPPLGSQVISCPQAPTPGPTPAHSCLVPHPRRGLDLRATCFF